MHMNQPENDRRIHTRVFFSPGDGVHGSFDFPTLEISSISANISDLSLGGLFFSINRKDGVNLNPDAPIILTEITTALAFQIKTNIELDIRRIQDFKILDVIGFGCKFKRIPEEDNDKLARFISWAIDNGRNHLQS